MIVRAGLFNFFSNEKDFVSASLYQQYLETDDKSSGDQILVNYPNSIYSDFVRLNEAKKNFINQETEQAIDIGSCNC